MIELRLIAALVAIVGIVGAGWWINHKIKQADQLQTQLDEVRATLDAERANRQTVENAYAALQSEADRARERRAALPATPVRLCPRASVPRTAETEDSAAPAGGVVPAGDGADHPQGPDIGPDLRAFADKCEQLSRELRAVTAM